MTHYRLPSTRTPGKMGIKSSLLPRFLHIFHPDLPLNLSSDRPLLSILHNKHPIILPALAPFLPQLLKFSLALDTHSPNAFSQPLMSFPILFNSLLNLSLIQPRNPNAICLQRRGGFAVMYTSFRIGRDGRKRAPTPYTGIPLSEAGFDFDDRFGEEDGFLLEAC